MASGLANTSYQIGSAISLAVMVTIAATTTDVQTGDHSAEALNAGFQAAFLWSGIVAFAGAVLTLLFVRTSKQADTNMSNTM
ncbi:hypothetical protein [Paenibacillus sp. SN-8-1]|uniref:hypothetical protein n=1 Tax=Paenibacillus sp. SN-8-1 TaxID=3435409 RepID=UPI003D9A4457